MLKSRTLFVCLGVIDEILLDALKRIRNLNSFDLIFITAAVTASKLQAFSLKVMKLYLSGYLK